MRYHGALVVLHWVLALLILASLGVGALVLTNIPNSSPDKLLALKAHMGVGAAILVLTVVRLMVRGTTKHPPEAKTGMRWADRLAPWAHWALYVGVLLMAGSGIGISVQANLAAIVFGGQGNLPADFSGLAARQMHGVIGALLSAVVVLHVVAALFHQFILRDGLLKRMGFGRRWGT